MSESMEAAKDEAKEDAKLAKKKPVAKDAKAGAPEANPAPETMPKDAVDGSASIATETMQNPAAPAMRRPFITKQHARYTTVATCGLVLGTVFGMVAAPRPQAGDGMSQIEASLEASRVEATRLNGEIERLGKTVASLRDSGEIARSDSRLAGATLTERMSKLEQTLDKRLAALGDTIERAEREQTAKLTSVATEKRAALQAAPAPAPAPVAVVPAPKPEPTQTGTIVEAKPKTETVEGWALRDVYDGLAMLEDRKRRLVEVGRGDSVPGIGRVEAIERRGRIWVVVTKQGVITPQDW